MRVSISRLAACGMIAAALAVSACGKKADTSADNSVDANSGMGTISDNSAMEDTMGADTNMVMDNSIVLDNSTNAM
ncbi:hypothetical protein [Flavisphingomonas formosensis]|uniref:hypothetical protein n=1 Tax=Flavisphingomonas formosensis TaxID=861534 RepID=UPI0012F75885|nr:hypothetical protein [Sphingomonas formosensis]